MSRQKKLWAVLAVAGLSYGLLLLGVRAASPAFLSLFIPIFFLLAAALPTLVVLYADRKSNYFDRPDGDLKCPVSMLGQNFAVWLYFGVMSVIGNRVDWDIQLFATFGFYLLFIPLLIEACGRMIHARLKSQARDT